MNSRANFWQFSLPKLYFGLSSFHFWMKPSISSLRFVVVPTCPNRPTSAPTCDFSPLETATFISVEFSSLPACRHMAEWLVMEPKARVPRAVRGGHG